MRTMGCKLDAKLHHVLMRIDNSEKISRTCGEWAHTHQYRELSGQLFRKNAAVWNFHVRAITEAETGETIRAFFLDVLITSIFEGDFYGRQKIILIFCNKSNKKQL